MAQGKKSFLFYADWGDSFDELSNEDAGKLIKHLCDYVRDKNPETDSVLIKALFAQFRNTLKRDLVKWDNRAEQSRINGVKGGRPKSKPKETQRTQRVNSKPRKPVRDSVSVTVTDNVNDNVIQMEVYRKFAHLQISFIEFDKLNAIYPKEKIDDCLDAIENYKKNTGYKSLYLTAKKWLKKDEETNTQKNDGKKFQYKFDVAEITRQAQNGELKR